MSTLNVDGTYTFNVDNESFVSLLVTKGEGAVECNGTVVEIASGDSIFVPANAGETVLKGSFEVLVSTL